MKSTTQRCAARFTATTASITDFFPLLILNLSAGRDSEANILITRRLEAIDALAHDERAAVLDSIFRAYQGHFNGSPGSIYSFVKPARLAAAESLLTHGMKAAPWQIRLMKTTDLMEDAWLYGDTAQAKRLARAGIALADSLTEDQRRSNDFMNLAQPLNQALVISDKSALLDSLRHSTSAYAALYRAHLDVLTGHHGIPAGFAKPIGELAPAISADFWFRRDDSTASRPVKGKVNVVVVLYPNFDRDDALEAHETYAALRRLAQRFSALEITLVTRTSGSFSQAAPPTPSVEGAMIAHAWLEERQLPGALAVTSTPFWRLPNPDRRRINRDTPNALRYSFSRTWLLPVTVAQGKMGGSAAFFLIDQNGAVVDAPFGVREVEAEWPELIEILFSRQVVSRQ